jgi:hypothetical protein
MGQTERERKREIQSSFQVRGNLFANIWGKKGTFEVGY